ncbi:laccase, partial [Campylobacter coli]|nr:laccase [Campylobacter coli]
KFKNFLNERKLDLKALVKFQAQNLGIKNIIDSNICSFDDEAFYSYRRDKTSKRFVSVVYLKG